jgi:hypothetical protein
MSYLYVAQVSIPKEYESELVFIDPAGSHNHPARDARALASGRLSLLLALEIASTGRATAD